jgi:hypothetical protein
MLKEFLAKKVLDRIWKAIVEAAKPHETKLTIKQPDIAAALEHHGAYVANWCSEITFRDLKRARATESTYIDPNFYVTPAGQQTVAEQKLDVVPMKTVLRGLNNNLVILGQPGAGKTTFLKRLALSLLSGDDQMLDQFSAPLLVRLYELTSDEPGPLITHLADLFALRFEFTADDSQDFRYRIRESVLLKTLAEMNALILLDGFDEIAPSRVAAVTADIQRLAYVSGAFRIVVSARTSSFQVNLSRCEVFELSPFDDTQIRAFCRQFFENLRTADDFLRDISQSPFADVTLRPLNLAHLCAIYERGGGIPDKPKAVYRKVVTLLLEEWDAQKPVRRMSQYANFSTDRKREFLARLAFELTRRGLTSEFGREHLYELYLEELQEPFDLPVRDCEKVATELETHTGLIARVKTETFAFTHKSLQEFLAAEYIVGLPTIPREWILVSRIPDELAIATAISTSPNSYFATIVFACLLRCSADADWRHVLDAIIDPKHEIDETGLTTFVTRFIGRLMLERADFTTSPDVAVAALMLYTVLRDRGERSTVAIARLIHFLLDERVHRSVLRMLHAYDVVTTRREGTQLRRTPEPEFDVDGPPVLYCPPEVIQMRDA